MDPVQTYETTITDRTSGSAFTFVTLPVRSLENRETPSVEQTARALGLAAPRAVRAPVVPIEPVDTWSLPFALDLAMGRDPAMYAFREEVRFRGRWPGMDPFRGPSEFAQYLTFAEVVPWESSPVGPKSLATLITATGTVGAGLGFAATGDPLLLVTVPGGILIGGAALGAGAALAEATYTRLRPLLGLPYEAPAEEPSDET